MNTRRRAAVSAGVCDLCGAPRNRSERRRLVWDSGLDGELVLADLCTRCAAQSDRVLEVYGGSGRNALRFTHEPPVSTAGRAPLRTVGGMIARGLFYVLVAFVTFVIVTLVTSRA